MSNQSGEAFMKKGMKSEEICQILENVKKLYYSG